MMHENENIIKKSDCPHTGTINKTESDQNHCKECDLQEDLRICTSCGDVRCCEDGNSHDTKHFEETGHPIIKPIHANYDFTWCYECQAYLK